MKHPNRGGRLSLFVCYAERGGSRRALWKRITPPPLPTPPTSRLAPLRLLSHLTTVESDLLWESSAPSPPSSARRWVETHGYPPPPGLPIVRFRTHDGLKLIAYPPPGLPIVRFRTHYVSNKKGTACSQTPYQANRLDSIQLCRYRHRAAHLWYKLLSRCRSGTTRTPAARAASCCRCCHEVTLFSAFFALLKPLYKLFVM